MSDFQRVPQSRGGSRWPRTIRIRQHASVTAADHVIDRVAYHSWDEVKEPCPLPARKLARNAQHGFGFYIAFPLAHKRKGIRRSGSIPSCSASGRPSATWIGTKRKWPRRSRLLTKRQPREHRTHTPSNRIRPCGELMLPGLFGSTTIDRSACMEIANTRETADATGVVVARVTRRLTPIIRARSPSRGTARP